MDKPWDLSLSPRACEELLLRMFCVLLEIEQQIEHLKRSISSIEVFNVEEIFRELDSDATGYLSGRDLSHFVSGRGLRITSQEGRDLVFRISGTRHGQSISFLRFCTWILPESVPPEYRFEAKGCWEDVKKLFTLLLIREVETTAYLRARTADLSYNTLLRSPFLRSLFTDAHGHVTLSTLSSALGSKGLLASQGALILFLKRLRGNGEDVLPYEAFLAIFFPPSLLSKNTGAPPELLEKLRPRTGHCEHAEMGKYIIALFFAKMEHGRVSSSTLTRGNEVYSRQPGRRGLRRCVSSNALPPSRNAAYSRPQTSHSDSNSAAPSCVSKRGSSKEDYSFSLVTAPETAACACTPASLAAQLRYREKLLQALEDSKTKLARRSDFSHLHLWKLFDPTGRGYATEANVAEAMRRLGLNPSRFEVDAFISRYSKLQDGKLRYSDSSAAFSPANFRLAEQLLNRQLTYRGGCPAPHLFFSKETRYLVGRTLRLLIEVEVVARKQRCNYMNSRVYRLCQLIDVELNGWLKTAEFKNALRTCGASLMDIRKILSKARSSGTDDTRVNYLCLFNTGKAAELTGNWDSSNCKSSCVC